MDSDMDAAFHGRKEHFQIMQDAQLTDVLRKVDEDGRSVLHVSATSFQGAPVVEYLLVDVDARRLVAQSDEEGWTPLHSAVSAGIDRSSALLIEAGADVNAKNSGGQTPLHYAASKGRTSLAELLLDNGACTDAVDQNGCTPLLRAASSGKLTLVQLLIDRGANVHKADKMGDTALHMAVECGHKDIAMYLVAKGSSLDAKNKEGKTPLELNEQFKRAVMLSGVEYGSDME